TPTAGVVRTRRGVPGSLVPAETTPVEPALVRTSEGTAMSAYNIVSVAGSDPSGGAGIQADLKSFSAHGTFGMSVITALTAQSTRGVTGVHGIPPEFVTHQLDTLLTDASVHAVKIGMLATAEVTEAVAEAIDRYELPNVVVDPVMVAKSGDRLLAQSATEALRTVLLPRADLITPNLPEAADLLDEKEATRSEEHTSELQSRFDIVCRLLLEKKKTNAKNTSRYMM